MPAPVDMGRARAEGRDDAGRARDEVASRLGEELAIYLTDAVRQLREIVNASADWISLVRGDATVVFASAACERMLGFRPDELVGRRLVELAHPDDIEAAQSIVDRARAGETVRVTYRMRRNDGGVIWVESLAQPPSEGEQSLAVATRDVTDNHNLEEQLRVAALHDPVTGLANRRQVDAEVEAAVARAERLGEDLGIVFLDLNGFKAINDAHGHAVGDLLLAEVANRLVQNVRRGDVAGRYGGDEFLVICPFRHSDETTAEHEVARLRAALAAPYQLGKVALRCTTSIGAALWRPGMTAAEIVAAADAQMYAEKARTSPR